MRRTHEYHNLLSSAADGEVNKHSISMEQQKSKDPPHPHKDNLKKRHDAIDGEKKGVTVTKVINKVNDKEFEWFDYDHSRASVVKSGKSSYLV